MKVRFKRPKTKGHLEELEVRGLWKAIALTKQIAESKEKISIETILEIHKTIFENAFPEAWDDGNPMVGEEKEKCASLKEGEIYYVMCMDSWVNNATFNLYP